MRCWIVSLALMGMVCGCGSREHVPAPGVIIQSPTGGSYRYREITQAHDTRADDNLQVTVDVVQVNAPAGAISGQDDLWRIVDARAIPGDLQARLNVNGVRAGVMSASKWDTVREVLGRAPDVVSQTATLAGRSRATLDARKANQQTIFYYDRDRLLQGRTYDDAQNLWGIRFAPDLVTPGSISLEVTPVVQSRRRQIRLNRAGDDYQVEFEQPETLLDLLIRTSVPVGSVLVLAPTRPAFDSASSIGRAFLTDEQQAGLAEHIIFLYPHLYRLEQHTGGGNQRAR